MQALFPPELETRILLFLADFELPRIASTCVRAKHLSLSETEYVRRVKERFVTIAPTFSGKHLMNARRFGLLAATNDLESASYWFL